MNSLSAFQSFALGPKETFDESNNRCVIYTRVSTIAQEDNSSLALQYESCHAFAKRNEYEIVDEFGGKGESAKEGSARKEFDRMMQFVLKKSNRIRYIVFYSYKRFSREGGAAIVKKEKLRARGIYIRSAAMPIDTSTPMGRAMEDLQLILSKADNDDRRQRCTDGMRKRLERGLWSGSAPIGYQWDRLNPNKHSRMVIPDPEKAPFIRKAFMLKYNSPNITITEIRKVIKKKGLDIPRASMSQILRNPFYCGIMVHRTLNGKVVQGKHEPIISKKIFLAVNNFLSSGNAHGWQHNEENNQVPLKRFMKCGCCGTNLTGYVVKKKGIYYYKCRIKGCKVNKNAAKLEKMFLEDLSKYKLEPELIPLIAREIRTLVGETTQDTKAEVKNLKTELTKIDKKIERLEERYFEEEEITRAEFNKFNQKLLTRKAEIEQEIAKGQRNSSNYGVKLDEALEKCSQLAGMWENGSYRTRQKLQKAVYPEGMFYDKATDTVRTPRVNDLLFVSSSLSKYIQQKNTGQEPDLSVLSRSVASARIELASRV